jgi:hypothetical protein
MPSSYIAKSQPHYSARTGYDEGRADMNLEPRSSIITAFAHPVAMILQQLLNASLTLRQWHFERHPATFSTWLFHSQNKPAGFSIPQPAACQRLTEHEQIYLSVS